MSTLNYLKNKHTPFQVVCGPLTILFMKQLCGQVDCDLCVAKARQQVMCQHCNPALGSQILQCGHSLLIGHEVVTQVQDRAIASLLVNN